MKKAITRTIIVLIIVNLITAGYTLAQDVIEEENQEVLDTQTQEADVAQREAEIAEKEAERQAEKARKQVKEAEKQMAEAEKQIQVAVQKQMDIKQKVKDLMVDIRIPDVNLPHLPHLSHFQQSSGGGVLVIPSAEMKVEDIAAINEDMNVMSRIFGKQLGQSNMAGAKWRPLIGINPFLGHGNRSPEAIYLEGYGALFLMNVNMPLSAPPEAQQPKEKTEEDTDPVWAQMRQEMYEPEGGRRKRSDDRPEEKYDAEKVETLKTNLIKTLKHATNIRGLKSDQLVILTLIGDGRRSAWPITQSFSYGSSGIVQTLPGAETGSLPPTVLTICAKKSDIDAFAKGELDYDQFRQRTGIFKSYAKAGENNIHGAEEHQVAHKEQPMAHEEQTAF